MDLPRFAIVRKNDELDYWELMAMNDLMRYEQARDELKRLRGKGYPECYLVAVTFIAGVTNDPERAGLSRVRLNDVLGHCWRSEMELPTDEDWRDHAEIARQDALDADAARPLLERLREAEADYTVTYGSGELYGEAADVLDAARRLWPLIERSTKGLVFTADRAGEVAADMAALRKALVA